MEGIPPEDIKEHEKQKTGIKNHNFPATDMIIECTLYTVCIQILFSNVQITTSCNFCLNTVS